ncbi:glycerate kinase [compost metagenome]
MPVVALAGSLGEGYEALHAGGISAAFSLAPGPITLQQALADAEKLLSERARDVMQLWMAAQKRML